MGLWLVNVSVKCKHINRESNSLSLTDRLPRTINAEKLFNHVIGVGNKDGP